MKPLLEEQLLAKVEYDTNGGCWLWSGYQFDLGYGGMRHEGETQYAHRLAYRLWVGPIPPERPHVCHRCDVRSCIRPDHLFVATHAENMADMVRKGRQWRGGRRRK